MAEKVCQDRISTRGGQNCEYLKHMGHNGEGSTYETNENKF